MRALNDWQRKAAERNAQGRPFLNGWLNLTGAQKAWRTRHARQLRDIYFAGEDATRERVDRWSRTFAARDRGYQLPRWPSPDELRDHIAPALRATWDMSPHWWARYKKPEHAKPFPVLMLSKEVKAALRKRPLVWWEPDAARWSHTRTLPAVIETICPVSFT